MLISRTIRPISTVCLGLFECFHRRVLESLDLGAVRAGGYAFQIEVTYDALRAGFRVLEVPIIFSERTYGQTKMSLAVMDEAARIVWRLRQAKRDQPAGHGRAGH